MSDDFPSRRLLRLVIAGLVFAIVANVLIIVMQIQWGSYAFAGNIAAIAACSGAIMLIRARMKGWL